jgi:hypothetical protein
MRCNNRCLAITLGVFLWAVVQPVWSLPAQVILLRHGHKLGRPGDYNLSPQGFARAMQLADWIPRCFGRPDAIRTYRFDSQTGQNARSYQTAVPLGVATGINISVADRSAQYSFAEGRRILTESHYHGKRVVLFWEHRRLPALAQGLGLSAFPPVADDDFDQIVVVRYSSPLRPVWHVFSQRELVSGGLAARGLCGAQSVDMSLRWSDDEALGQGAAILI